MGLLTYAQTLIAGTPENVTNVQAMFDQVRSLVNGNLDSANLAAGAVADTNMGTTAKQLAPQLKNPGAFVMNHGRVTAPPAFGGARSITFNVPHGLGTTPTKIILANAWIGAANTSSGLNEQVVNSVVSADATNISVLSALSPGVTAGVGSSQWDWLAFA